MARFLILLWPLLVGSTAEAGVLVSANGQTLKLGPHTRCSELETIKKQDFCDCCLIQQVMVHKKSPELGLSKCIKNQECQQLDINFEQAKKNLSPLEIVNLDKLEDRPDIANDCNLNPETVVKILHVLKKYNLVNLPDKIFAQQSSLLCLKAKMLGDQVKGIHRGQLFAISYNRRCVSYSQVDEDNWQPLYILKETKKGLKEIANLHQLSRSVLSQEKIPTDQLVLKPEIFKNQAMARITFEDRHFKIKRKGRTHYFSLLQTAAGKSIHSHLKSFAQKTQTMGPNTLASSQEFSDMKHIFFRLGYAIAKLHQKYSRSDSNGKIITKTYIHGDFHAQNIFYDLDTEDVTLIDNETFALSLKRQSSGINDIADLYLLHTVRTVAHRFASSLETNLEMGIDDQTWHALWQELIIGYIKALDLKDRFEVIKAFGELHAEFNRALSSASVFSSVRNLKDQRVLKRIGPSIRRSHLKHQDLEYTFTQALSRLVNQD